MADAAVLRPHSVRREDRADGTILLRSGYDMSQPARRTGDWLDHWAVEAPDRVFLAERNGDGWREVTYAQALTLVQRIARGLLVQGLGPERPIMILSGNSVNHGLLALAAQYAGIPSAPIAEQYSLIPAAQSRLAYAFELIDPALVYAEDPEAYGAALALAGEQGRVTLTAAGLAEFDGEIDLYPVRKEVGPDTIAKYLLTSGSTSDPKAVVTTQGMMCANQAQLHDALPFLQQRPPILVDWLPWNHTFGGSYNFNLVLANGGSLYVDDGKPLPTLFPRTVENLGRVSGTISFNVPVGFAQLVEALRTNADLAKQYFQNLDMIFYAGASLSQATWQALEELAVQTIGRVPLITSSWGLTETAPGAILQTVPAKGAGIVGVPMTGMEVKLVPDDDGRMDVRVKGPNVFTTYLKNPVKTAEAFDDEGYFLSGDAMRFVDPSDMNKGLKFDGRLSEDFKLMTGTWVRAANLRLELLPVLAPFAQDLILTGEGRDEVGVLIVPNRPAIEAAGHSLTPDRGAELSAELQAEIMKRLTGQAGESSGSANRVTRALILSEPPSMGDGEVTAKGNLNFAKILQRRADLVARLYSDNDEAVIHVRDLAMDGA